MITETLYLCSTPEELDSVLNSLKEKLDLFVTLPHSASFREAYASENPLELQLCSSPADVPERKISSIEVSIEEEVSELDIDKLDDEIFALITNVMSEYEDIEYFSFLE